MLKSEYHKKLLKMKEKENAKEENEYKAQEIKLMKRKAKDLKDTVIIDLFSCSSTKPKANCCDSSLSCRFKEFRRKLRKRRSKRKQFG